MARIMSPLRNPTRLAAAHLDRLAGTGFGRGLQLDLHGRALAAAHDRQAGLAAEPLEGEPVAEGIGIVDALAVKLDDDVVAPKARFFGRALGVYRRHEDAHGALETDALGELAVD